MAIKRCIAFLLALLVITLTACKDEEVISSSIAEDITSSSSEVIESGNSDVASSAEDIQSATVEVGGNLLTGGARAEDAVGLRPAAIMISNSFRALPQRGLQAADVLVEMLAQDNATNILALYDDYRAISTTGPIGVTYDQFVQFAMPLNAVQVHTKESPYADNLLASTATKVVEGTILGEIAFGFDFVRTTPRPGGKLNEYSWFTDGALITTGMNTQQIPSTGELASLFKFGVNTMDGGQDAKTVTVAYSDESRAEFLYDDASSTYFKYIDGAPHSDENGGQLQFTNVILLSTEITFKADSDQYFEYNMSRGSGWYFSGGKMIPITWVKGYPTDPLILYDENMQELDVNIGKSYIGFVPSYRADAAAWSA